MSTTQGDSIGTVGAITRTDLHDDPDAWIERIEALRTLDESEIHGLSVAGLDLQELTGELSDALDKRLIAPAQEGDVGEWKMSAEQAWQLTCLARNLSDSAESVEQYADLITEAVDYMTRQSGSIPNRLADLSWRYSEARKDAAA